MAVTLADLVRDTTDMLHSYVQVKNRFVYLNADINDSVTTLVLSSSMDIRQIQPGMVLQLGSDDSTVSELVRVRSVDTAANSMVVTRAVSGTTAASWVAATCEIQVEPEYPVSSVIREVNNTILSFPPDLWAYATEETTVSGQPLNGYDLPSGAVGVVSVQYLPSGVTDSWQRMRRWRYDPVSNTVTVLQWMDVGQALKIRYRMYPQSLTSSASTLTGTAKLDDTTRDLIVLGALHKLMLGRASGRLVDTRAETPLNGQYRTADPVMGAVRQVFALYQQRLAGERERQRLLNPVHPHTTF